jgi:hypothetical protein
MTFLDCPAFLSHDGQARCGLPAEITNRYTLPSTDERPAWSDPAARLYICRGCSRDDVTGAELGSRPIVRSFPFAR